MKISIDGHFILRNDHPQNIIKDIIVNSLFAKTAQKADSKLAIYEAYKYIQQGEFI